MALTRYIVLNPDGETIYSISDIGGGDEDIEIEVDDDFDDMDAFKCRYKDGKLVEDTSLEEDLEAAKAYDKARLLQSKQMENLVTMILQPQIQTMSFTATTGAKVSSFADEWSGDSVQYEPGMIRRYNGNLYIVNEGQGHTSQPGWNPEAVPALWSLIKIAPDGNREWVEPTGAHNDYAEGELCWYPDYDTGKLYKSKQNGNVWPPNDTAQSTWIELITG